MIARHYPAARDEANPYRTLLDGVIGRQARLIARWMLVGFIHGVMNTDNMSILGLTIDYGPYGWIDNFDPDWTPNTTDAQHRRYRFGQQAHIAQWKINCRCCGSTGLRGCRSTRLTTH